MFPPHIAEVLNRFGVRPDTKAVLYDLYLTMGSGVLERFADFCEGETSLAHIQPDDVRELRGAIVDHYLRQSHPRWFDMKPTPSLWHPRVMEGRAAGLAMPLGELRNGGDGFGDDVAQIARRVLGESQPLPSGMVMFGKNAHSGGRTDTISFDVIPERLADALEVSRAAGQQHTLPGSVGETSGTIDAIRGVALLWEIQPNVLKPSGDRNRAIRQLFRRHRNWHVITLVAALQWLQAKNTSIYVVHGRALQWTHELNPAAPMSKTVMELHDRTVRDVVAGFEGFVSAVTPEETEMLLQTELMNTSLGQHVSEQGGSEALWRIRLPQNTDADTVC